VRLPLRDFAEFLRHFAGLEHVDQHIKHISAYLNPEEICTSNAVKK